MLRDFNVTLPLQLVSLVRFVAGLFLNLALSHFVKRLSLLFIVVLLCSCPERLAICLLVNVLFANVVFFTVDQKAFSVTRRKIS